MALRRLGVRDANNVPLDELEAQCDELDRKVTPGARLWTREWAATSARGGLGSLSAYDAGRPRVVALQRRFAAVIADLQRFDEVEFSSTQDELRRGEYTPARFRADLEATAPYERDVFARKLFGIDWPPPRETERGQEMVYYEASSIEAVLEVVDDLDEHDILFDLGCGLGLVVMVATWIAGVRAMGVEYEPSYCRVARERIADFGLSRAAIIEGDAASADYSEGTVFYFFHPFEGATLDAVLGQLEAIASTRAIRIYARGACSAWFDEIPWMHRVATKPSGLGQFAATG